MVFILRWLAPRFPLNRPFGGGLVFLRAGPPGPFLPNPLGGGRPPQRSPLGGRWAGIPAAPAWPRGAVRAVPLLHDALPPGQPGDGQRLLPAAGARTAGAAPDGDAAAVAPSGPAPHQQDAARHARHRLARIGGRKPGPPEASP